MIRSPYQTMWERQDALERLDMRIQWGDYEIRVLRFHLTSFAPGKVIGMHKHNEFEFHFIPSGKGIVQSASGQVYLLRDGMFYVTGPGVMHYQEADAQESMEELCLHIDIVERSGSGGIDCYEQAESRACIQRLEGMPLLPTVDLHGAMPYFLEAYQACTDNWMGAYTTIKQCIIQILLRAVRAYDSGGLPTSLPARDMNTYRYRFAMQYIRANYTGSVTLEDLADKMHISSRQLQRIFKNRHPERSFSVILEEVRLEAVCRKLVESDQPIEMIALQEGFSSGNYLHAVFRKRFGLTPSQYREKHQALMHLQRNEEGIS
ncbi:helix-turn-helix domain-containing protein [Paenibacillus hexagrammi]|uniref:Helix-turn-helix domain-containing protein n=1 Tax=Paenibacillus hexagrammi TaxID=2908839 RepID=A0ABY3SEU2_9BACL|nr:helix-turn-helix domain-containing protein [Paenibacillus sp. YPD9-1]UJF32513.1 helix-turn-helix domain-containing protein [Paenibacillus sp. YPD9-1]